MNLQVARLSHISTLMKSIMRPPCVQSKTKLPVMSCLSLATIWITALALLLINAAQAQPNCSDGSSTAFVQYKVVHAALRKCIFPEFEQATPPRVRWYHNKDTHVTDIYSYSVSGTNGCYVSDSDFNCYWSYDLSGGAFAGSVNYSMDLTEHQVAPGAYCAWTNSFVGGTSYTSVGSDGRTNHHQTGCMGCPPYNRITYSVASTETDSYSPVYTTISNVAGWYIAYSEKLAGYETYEAAGGCGYPITPLGTYPFGSTNEGYYQLSSLPDAGTILSPTRKQDCSTTTNDIWDICSFLGTYVRPTTNTVDLTFEYTDGELRSNILGIMPAYPSGWFTPNPVDSSLLDQCAYSLINKEHDAGLFGGWGFYGNGAELQKMKYRLCVPVTEAGVKYLVSWDLITFNFTTGAFGKRSKSTSIMGTGDSQNAAVSCDFEEFPPDWDPSNYGGWVVTWVENVTVRGMANSETGWLPGSGPFLNTGARGCGTCGSAGDGNQGLDRFLARFGLGWSTNGFPGILEIGAGLPSLSLATPAGLFVTVSEPELETVWIGNQLRQAKATQALMDIQTNSFSYEIRYYLPSQVGSKVSGVYNLTGSPFVVWKVENPDASTDTYNRLRLTETRGADVKVYDYTYSFSSGGWKLTAPGSLREEEWASSITTFTNSYSALSYLRSVTNTIRVPGGSDQFKVRRVYQRFGGTSSGFEGLIEETLSPESNPQTTTYSYYEDQTAYGSSKPLKLVVRPDGSWTYYVYDSQLRVTSLFSGLRDEPVPTGAPPWSGTRHTDYSYYPITPEDGGTNFIRTPRSELDYVDGLDVSQKYTIILPGERRDIRCQRSGAGWDATDNLVTTTKFYTSGENTNRVKSIENSDGTMQFFEYVRATDGSTTNTVYTGRPNEGKTAIVDGTKSVTIRGPLGQMMVQNVIDIASGLTLSTELYSNYDEFARPQRVTHLDGTYEDTQFACCGVDSTTDREGVVTYYVYDALKRQTASIRQNVTTTNILDAAGRTVKSIRIGSDNSQIVQGQSKYDLAGELLYQTNALNGVTSYAQSVDGSGHKVRTTTNPDGGTRIETYFKDGSLLSVTGTAEFPVYYEYGIELEGGYYRTFTKEIKGSTTGTEWTKSYTDMLGRAYKTVYADATPDTESDNPFTLTFYNDVGQMWKQVDPDGVSTLYQYNAKGELAYTALDMDRNDAIDFTGTDRITSTVSDVLANYGTTVRRTRSYVWGLDNQNTSNLVSTAEASVDGLRSWNTVWNNGQSVTSRSQTAFGGSGYRYATNSAPDNSYSVSISRYGTNVSSTRYDSSGNQLASVSFGYDAHGRQSCVTDARNGTTTNWFNEADQVSGTRTPVPGTGQSAQVTTNYFDPSLRTWKSTLADNTSVTNEFFLTGMLKKTYGSRTYPVEYTYDTAGRMATMKTWQNFAGALGAATTTWYYDVNRGWLTNKMYADGLGTIYSNTPAGRLALRQWARAVSGSPLVALYAYNNVGELQGVDYSDGTADVTYDYDRRGRQKIIAQSGGTKTTLTFNDIGAVLTESYSGGVLNGLSVTNAYDQYLRRTNLTARNGAAVLSKTTYGYDAASRLATVGDGTNTTAYSYLANSALVGNVWFTNNTTLRMTTTKTYDYLNRLTAMASSAGGSNVAVFNYAYNAANQRMVITNVDSSRWVYTYDALGQVTGGKKYWSDGTPVAGQQFEYGFDDIGNRKQTKVGGDALGFGLQPASYANNLLNQITSRDVPGYVNVLGSARTNATITLWSPQSTALYAPTTRKGEYYRGELPLNNNTGAVWLTITNLAVLNNGTNADIVTNTVGNAFVPKTAEVFQYDRDGNLTNDGRWTYTWDAENRLVRMVANTASGPQQRIEFQFDARGRRIGKKVWNNTAGSGSPAVELQFVYDGWNLLAELNLSHSALRTYVWGLDLSGSLQGAGGVGGLLAVYDSSTINNQPSTHFVAYDGNGNVAIVVKATDATASGNYEYGPFGEVLRATGPMAKTNPFRFSTKYQDDETDLLYYGYRYYNASTGRWTSKDPIDEYGGLNLYGFSENDGINKVDVAGLWPSRAPYDDHTSFTYAAVDRIRSRLVVPGTVVDRMKTILAQANVSVDRGHYFLNNYWHFNRNTNDSVTLGIQEYRKILIENTVSFYIRLSQNGNDQVCQDELRRLGRLSHAWQDYYAHAVALSYNGGTVTGPDSTVGSINPASAPYNPDPQMKPSSYDDSTGGEHGKLKFGVNLTTGMYEPGNRAPDRTWRRDMSVTFTSQRFQAMMQFWYDHCACTKTATEWAN